MMKKRPSTGDRISELPDEILHCILCRAEELSSLAAAQTIALSTRWRDVWSSYPIVKFDYTETKKGGPSGDDQSCFEKFCDATIERFSRDSLLSMETLRVSLDEGHVRVAELLDLASQRKAEHVEIAMPYKPSLPLKSLSNFAAKMIRLQGLRFSHLNLPLSLDSLRFLHLHLVNFEHGDKDLSDLIASSPLLETLELGRIVGLRELKLCTDPPNLNKLIITDCHLLHKIEIVASRLQTLKIQPRKILSEFELTVPRLNSLEISKCHWEAGNLEAVISKLPSLRSLTLADLYITGEKKKLKLSSPNLEELTLHVYQLEEIELNAGPRLAKFLLRFDIYNSMDVFKKCEINRACPWELDIINYYVYTGCFFLLKSLLARFPNKFSTVKFVSQADFAGTFKEEKVDHTLPSVDIKHLIISKDEKALLDGFLWVMHPELLSITDFDCSGSSFLNSLKLAATTPQPWHGLSCREEVNGRRNWPHQLKDVKIVNRDIDRAFTGEIKEEELISLSKSAIASLASGKQVCFMLIWR